MNAVRELADGGRRLFVVEDSTIVVLALERLLAGTGIRIEAFAGSLDEALVAAQTVDASVALLDINLHGDMVFPVAEVLVERGLELVFATGYAEADIPLRFASVPKVAKPYAGEELLAALAAAFARSEAAASA